LVLPISPAPKYGICARVLVNLILNLIITNKEPGKFSKNPLYKRKKNYQSNMRHPNNSITNLMYKKIETICPLLILLFSYSQSPGRTLHLRKAFYLGWKAF
jgi:hypothetical protein